GYAAALRRAAAVLPGRVEEPTAETGLGREADRVHHAVEVGRQALGEGIEVRRVGHVQLDDLRPHRELPRRALGQAHDATERGQHDLGTLLLRDPRHRERDRLVVQHPGHQDALAVDKHQSWGTSTSVALCPPKPNELESTGARAIVRGAPETTSIGAMSSPSRSWFATGGTIPSRPAWRATIASIAPAAPMR